MKFGSENVNIQIVAENELRKNTLKNKKKIYITLLAVMSLLIIGCTGMSNIEASQVSFSSIRYTIVGAKEEISRIHGSINTEIANKEKEQVSEPEQTVSNIQPQIDMSGDYIGEIASPLPPMDSAYTIYNNDNPYECIAIYIENIDNGNFKFRLTTATQNSSNGEIDEDILFNEHIAHYNPNGYYEYIGKEYNLYFKYSVDERLREYTATAKSIDVYGLDKLFNSEEYSNPIYEISAGNRFLMNYPFTG